MDNFNLKILTRENFTLVVLFLCFMLFKISVSAIHSNPLKMSALEIQEGLPFLFINDAD